MEQSNLKQPVKDLTTSMYDVSFNKSKYAEQNYLNDEMVSQ